MATTNFTYANPAIISLGSFAAPATQVGRTAIRSSVTSTNGNEIQFLATGSSLTLPYNTNVQSAVSITVSNPDGTSAVTTTPTLTLGNVWTDLVIPLQEGVQKRVKIKWHTQSFYVETVDFIKVTGDAPAIAAIPGWTTPQVFNAAFRTLCQASQASDILFGTFTYSNAVSMTAGDCAIRLPGGNLTGIAIFLFGPQKVRIAKSNADGSYSYVSASVTGVGAGWNLVEIPLGLDPAQKHELMIVSVRNVTVNIQSVMALGGSFATAAAPGFSAGAYICFGASNTSGDYAGALDSSIGGYANKLMMQTGRPIYNRGNSGITMSNPTNGLATLTAQVTGITGVNNAAFRIILEGSRNDTDFYSAAEYEAAYLSQLQKVIAATTVVPIDCILLLSKGPSTDSMIAAFNTAILNCIALVNNARVSAVTPPPDFNYLTDTSEGVHFNDSGTTKWVANYFAKTAPVVVDPVNTFQARRTLSRNR